MSDDTDMLIPVKGPGKWHNWHETIEGQIKGIDKVRYPPDNPVYGSAAINRCTRQIQRSIASAKVRRLPYRAVGRGWSLSEAPLARGGILLDTSELIGRKRLGDGQLDPGYPGNAQARAGLCLVQCGNYISELNEWLESDRIGLSFKTTGAANGQTIAGAAATGTHGSALDQGQLHDQIVAIHLVASESRQYWIERASYPVLKPAMAQSLGAELKRDDDATFNAVLMGLGGFGVIHNVVIEARPRFLLETCNYAKDRNGAQLVLDAAMRRRLGALDFTSDPRLDPPGMSGRPYFFQAIVNPHTNPPQILITQMAEKAWTAGYRPDYAIKQAGFGPGFDFLSVAGQALNLFSGLVPLFSNLVAQQMFKLGTTTASWGETFGFKVLRTKVASGSVAVPLNRALDALDALIALNQQVGPVPLVFGCRYVRKSPALLALAQWDPTFVVSLDGVYNAGALNFMQQVPAAMEARNIPFTQHWGKTNGYNAARVQAAFGAGAAQWQAARQALLPDPADRALFETDYLRAAGLA
jgi:FAD/FMN-containing dehydrogenase